MEWFALIIPILGLIVGYIINKDKLAIWEYLVVMAAVFIFILIFKLTAKTIMMSDIEYRGSIIVEARYYEYWETYVKRTCHRTVKVGKVTTSVPYDCSYCDKNSPYWMAYDNFGNSFSISKQKYESLIKQWSANPVFHNLNRDIKRHGSCGQDGNMYSISWNNKIETSESSVIEETYTNPVQASHSAFKLPYISHTDAKQLGLYKYPEIYDTYKQQVILGIDSIYKYSEINNIEKYYQFFNGYHGPKNKLKLFILLFYNKNIDIAFKQQAYWDGGNQNELVICIGLDKNTKEIKWVKPFSWTDNKRIIVDVREEIANLKYFDPFRVYNKLDSLVAKKIIYKSFKKDFSYLTIDLSIGQLIWIYVISIIITVGMLIWCITNEFDLGNKPF